MQESNLPSVITNTIAANNKSKPSIHSALPVFSRAQTPAVYIANSRYDAILFCYSTPLTLLGLTGYIVDYGNQIGFFPSTWQGQPNTSQLFQDLQTLIQLAQHRLRNPKNYNALQLGKWSAQWIIAGENLQLIDMLKKLINAI
jgi:hypothetical protein